MSTRNAQDDVRVVYAARRNYAESDRDILMSDILMAIDYLQQYHADRRLKSSSVPSEQNEQSIGHLLMVTLELANKLEIDGFSALKKVLQKQSP